MLALSSVVREEPALLPHHCSYCVCFCSPRIFHAHQTRNQYMQMKPDPFASHAVEMQGRVQHGFRVHVCVSLQVEPSKPLYGMPPSGSAAAPPPSSTPAYMLSHQYQRKCFTCTHTTSNIFRKEAFDLEKYLEVESPKTKA